MSKKTLWLAISVLVAVSLVMAACGPPPVPERKGEPKQAPAPVAGETEKKPQVAAPAAPERLITVALRKVDGTPVVKQVERPKYGGTIVTRLSSDIFLTGIDPALTTVTQQSYFFQAEKLIKGDPARGRMGTDETPWYWWEWPGLEYGTGNLAERWEIPDDQTMVFHIRKGVRWALDDREASRLVGDRELTADDVVWSLKRLFEARSPGTSLRLSQMREITAPDKSTVVVKLPKAGMGPFWIYAGNAATIHPREVVEKYGDMNRWARIVGTGAFMIKDYLPDSISTWVRNPNYWGYDPVLGKEFPLPYADAVKVLIIPDASTYHAALRVGKIDLPFMGTESPDVAADLRRTAPHLKERVFEGGGMTRFAMRMDKKELPFQDIRVRRALLMAINHQEMVDTIFRGQASILSWPIPNSQEFRELGWHIPLKQLPPEIQELYEYHPDKAKALLGEAGYPNGFKTSVVVTAGQVDTIAVIKDYWAKIGIDLTLDVRESAVYSNLWNGKSYPEMVVVGLWGTPGEYPYHATGERRNTSVVSNPYIDERVAKIFENYWNKEKRSAVMSELFKYTLAQAYYINLPVGYMSAFWQPWLNGWNGETTVGYRGQAEQFAYFWLDLDLKKKLGF